MLLERPAVNLIQPIQCLGLSDWTQDSEYVIEQLIMRQKYDFITEALLYIQREHVS